MKLHARESLILAEDFAALVDWYVAALGFTVTRRFGDDYLYANLENEHGIRLGIADAKQMGITPCDRANNTVVLQFQIEDVQWFLKHIAAHGGTVTMEAMHDKKHGFWFGGFADPEGNPFWVVDETCP